MHKGIQWSCAVLFVGLCYVGCNSKANQPADYEYPTKDPICLIENDPNLTVYEWTAEGRKFQPLPVGKVLVIPLYRNYHFNGGVNSLAIAHPFLYTQCEDIEKKLAAFGQRDHLARLIIWAHGYFPTGMPHLASWSPTVNGQRVNILELQRCVHDEEPKLAAAMKILLLNGDFVIEKMLTWKVRPPYSNEPTLVNEPYDFARLVRSELYAGRFFKYGTTNGYVLWAFNPGTRIINRLSPEEKKTVAAFAAQAMEKAARSSSTNDKDSAK